MIRYLAALLLAVAGFARAGEAPLNEGAGSDIGYASVQEALEALRANPNASGSEQGGWLIFNDRTNQALALWSFTTPGHPAHPAVVRREPVERAGSVYIQMAVLCQATKEPCDQLVRDFEQLNEQMSQAIKRQSGGQAP
jgi:hypothetical protein